MNKDSSVRRSIPGGLEIRALSIVDCIILSSFAAAVLILQYVYHFPCKQGLWLWVSVSLIPGFATIITTMGTRFKSLYFSIIWLISCLILCTYKLSEGYFPLASFALYHILRLVFWKKYHREFIPFMPGKGFRKKNMYRFVSKSEGRSGSPKDKRYMQILMLAGYLIFMVCMFGMIGKKIF